MIDLSWLSLRLRENWRSGITVALVNVPLSISLGIAAGATPLMGVITAIWAGLTSAIIGGSKFNIIGPTGALSGVLAAYVLTHGAASLPMLATMTGVMTLIVYLLRWERYIVFIPASVIHGFTLGVAFIIGLNQLNFALGLTGLPTHPHLIENIWESLQHLGNLHVPTILIFLAGLAFLLVAVKKFPRIPGAIILAIVGVGVGYMASHNYLPFTLQTLFTKFGEIDATLWQVPELRLSSLWSRVTLTAAATVTLIAILETLISAKIADGMTHTRFNQRREILGLGVANVISGLFGGIPATAALARTALNVKSGATHQSSAVLNALVVALIALVLLPGFKYLPLATVASILVFVAIRMVEHEHFKHFFHLDKSAFFLSLLVALLSVAQDPIIGILVGATISLLIFVRRVSHLHGEVMINRNGATLGHYQPHELKDLDHHGDLVVYRFGGELTYVNGQGHLSAIRTLHQDTKAVILSFRNLFYVDIDGLEIIQDIIEHLEDEQKFVALSGVRDNLTPLFQSTTWYRRLAAQDRIFTKLSQAFAALQQSNG